MESALAINRKDNFFIYVIKKISKYLENTATLQKLVLVTAVCFFVRFYRLISGVAVTGDSIGYMLVAENILSDGFFSTFDSVFPPLYPLAMATLSLFVGDIEVSARIVSFVFSIASIPVIFYIGKYIFNEKIGLTAAFFVSINNFLNLYSSEVMTEGMYSFIAAVVVYTGVRVVNERSFKMAFIFGIFSALAYLTRPEAIGFICLTTLWILFYSFSLIKEDWKERLLLILSSWMVFLLITMPYLLFILEERGSLEVSGKLSVDLLSDMAVTNALDIDRLLLSFKFIEHIFSMPLLIFFLLGLVFCRKEIIKLKGVYVLSLILIFWSLYFVVLPNRRYFSQLLPIALIFSASGFWFLYYWAKEYFDKREQLVATVLVVFLFFFTLSQLDGLSHKPYLAAEKHAGLWLKSYHKDGDLTVLSLKRDYATPIVVYYAKSNLVILPEGKLEDVVALSKKHNAQYLVGFVSYLKSKVVDFEEESGKFLKELKSFDIKHGERYVVYSIL